MTKPTRPRGTNQLAKLIVDLAIGEIEETPTPADGNDPAPVALGRKGGLKGSTARADSMPPGRRAEIAKQAAAKRWRKPG